MTGPKCPNHNVPLIRTNSPGIGICPVSDARFAYDEDQAEKTRSLQITSLGTMVETCDWGVKFVSGHE